MAKFGQTGFAKITTRQVALLTLLGAMLAAALLYNYQAMRTESVAEASSAAGAVRRRGGTSADANPPRRAWPQVALTKVLEHDPFARPEALQVDRQQSEEQVASGPLPDADDQADLQSAADALQNERVTVIVRGDQGVAAAVGKRLLRVGDVIDGYRVMAIEHGGVHLKRIEAN
jgi:hypothetical protein